MSRIRVANAPCSWGVLEFEGVQKQVGYSQVLDEMKEAGYAGTELGDWGFMPTEPTQLRDELARRGLSMVGAFVPVALRDEAAHAPGVEVAVRTARLLAAVAERPFVVLSDDNGKVRDRVENAGRVDPKRHGLRPDEWRTFARGAERIASAVRDATGARTVFHHHCAGFAETPTEVDALLEHSDKQLLGLCLDTGHLAFGGGDPMAALKKYGDRVWHVHFKDCSDQIARRSQKEKWDYFASVRAGIFCELGHGTVPFADIVKALRERDYDGWIVVEQDVLPALGTPLESAVRNRKFLAGLGL